MKLDPHGREYVSWELADAPVTGTFEVSFDDGATWSALTRSGTTVTALVAGPSAPTNPGGTVVLVLGRNVATIRATSSPQILIRPGGPIDVE